MLLCNIISFKMGFKCTIISYYVITQCHHPTQSLSIWYITVSKLHTASLFSAFSLTTENLTPINLHQESKIWHNQIHEQQKSLQDYELILPALISTIPLALVVSQKMHYKYLTRQKEVYTYTNWKQQ